MATNVTWIFQNENGEVKERYGQKSRIKSTIRKEVTSDLTKVKIRKTKLNVLIKRTEETRRLKHRSTLWDTLLMFKNKRTTTNRTDLSFAHSLNILGLYSSFLVCLFVSFSIAIRIFCSFKIGIPSVRQCKVLSPCTRNELCNIVNREKILFSSSHSTFEYYIPILLSCYFLVVAFDVVMLVT